MRRLELAEGTWQCEFELAEQKTAPGAAAEDANHSNASSNQSILLNTRKYSAFIDTQLSFLEFLREVALVIT